jgi:hypothetical protein
MSERSFRRERERRIAAARKRDARRVRKTAAAAATVGAFVLGAPAVSSAATYVVNSTGDTGATTCDPNDTTQTCELRDAIGKATGNSEADEITFDSSISGDTITLADGPLGVSDSYQLTINGGPTPESIYIDGAYGSTVLIVDGTPYGDDYPGLTLTGLTIQNGSGYAAGGIANYSGDVLVTNSTVTGNTGNGAQVGDYSFAGAGGIMNQGRMVVDNSTIGPGNTSEVQTEYYPVFGGGGIANLGDLTVTGGSIITGNSAAMQGGGIFNGFTNYPTSLKIDDATIEDNFAFLGGGVAGFNFLSEGGQNGPIGDVGATNVDIGNSTISGNHAVVGGGGVGIKYLGGSARWNITHSTISNNETYEGDGGGVLIGYQCCGPFTNLPQSGTLRLTDSTISGNYAADYGGGVMLGSYAQKYQNTLTVNNSTIASNEAEDTGGGIGRGFTDPEYATYDIPVFSTIVADNTGAGAPDDLTEVSPLLNSPEPAASLGEGFDLSFSLVEAPIIGAFSETPPGSNVFGVDPQLGGLANNGGPTLTQLPSINSPVVDRGSAPGNLTTDQRGDARTVDTGAANANDGTDIGSVELATGPPFPPPPPPPTAGSGTKVGTLKKKHKKRRRVLRTKNEVAKVRITFRSSNPGVRFQCSVDGGAFSPCTSPFVTKLAAAGGKGKNHNIAIKQVDSAGNQVGNVRVFKFRVVLKD